MAVLQVLDGSAARRWADESVGALRRLRAEIDALNVYPVPDGDTGTNLHLTLAHGRDSLRALTDGATLGAVADAFARGTLLGARGNSGIITAQLLRGLADEFAGLAEAGPEALRNAFTRADEEAWAAVAEPVEGTILSVSRAVARAVRDDDSADLAGVVTLAADAARTALDRTPEQLEVLRRAGVVDAGGRGLVVLLDSLVGVVTGAAPEQPATPDQPSARGEPGAGAAALALVADGCDAQDASYEVTYLLDAGEDAVARLRDDLAAIGDSLVVVGGARLWNVHVHTGDPGLAVEAGIAAGRPRQIRITHLGEQVRSVATVGRRRAPAAAGVVAFAAGSGLASLFEEAGAVAVRSAAGHRVSTGEVLEAVRSAGATGVVVLPNDPDTLGVADAAAGMARAEGLRVTVLPTRAQVQGLAALAVHDPDRDVEDDVVAMSAAAAATRHGAVTVASREAITSAGHCRAGDVLGVVDGDFAVIGHDLTDVAVEVLERLLAGGGELVTLVVGADSPAGLADAVREGVRRRRWEVDVHVVDGGQPRYPLLVGVE